MNLKYLVHRSLMTALFVFSAFSPVSGFAIPIVHDSYDDFLAKSKSDPKRLYILKISTTWCGPCKKQSEAIHKISGKKTQVSRAYWSTVDVDLDEAAYDAFLRKAEIPRMDEYPTLVVFKAAKPLGTFTGWNSGAPKDSLLSIEKFFTEVAQLSLEVRMQARHKDILRFSRELAQPEGEALFWGISGYEAPKQNDTDDFGRLNLKEISRALKEKSFEALFAPAVIRYSTAPTKSGFGVLLVENPLISVASQFQDPMQALRGLEETVTKPARNLRILMTGHGHPKGIQIGHRKKDKSELNGEHHDEFEEYYLRPNDLIAPIKRAREAGKIVQAIAVQCYSGVFGDVLMPDVESKALGVACGAFAALPEKKAEGCYNMTYGVDRKDYLGLAMKLKNSKTQSGRDLHYEIVVKSQGRDIPMLSSEYFLLNGPGGELLGKADRATAPPFGIIRKDTKYFGVYYIDRVNVKLIKAVKNGIVMKYRQVELVEDWKRFPSHLTACTRDFLETSLSARNAYKEVLSGIPIYTNLRNRFVGTYGFTDEIIYDCDESLDVELLNYPRETVDQQGKVLSIEYIKSSQTLSTLAEEIFDPYGADLVDLSEEERKIEIKNLKTEARVALSHIVPWIMENGKGGQLYHSLLSLAKQTRQIDLPRAKAIMVLTKALKKDLDIMGSEISFTTMLLDNFSPHDVVPEKLKKSRLAHLVAATIAELQLRESAKIDRRAAELVRQLDAIRECENGIL
ncbi:MAG: thioredoxin family protein [Bdellovibrionota bacterium]